MGVSAAPTLLNFLNIWKFKILAMPGTAEALSTASHDTRNKRFFFLPRPFFDFTFTDKGLCPISAFLMVDHFYRSMHPRVTRGLAGLMHFETPFQIFSDPRIEWIVAAFENIKKPISAGFFPPGNLLLFLKPLKHFFIGWMHLRIRSTCKAQG